MADINLTPEREKEYREKIKMLRYLDDDFFNAYRIIRMQLC